MKTSFVAVLVCLLCFTACRHEVCTRGCNESNLSVVAQGYDETEVDTVIVERFTDNGIFDTRVDSFRIGYHNVTISSGIKKISISAYLYDQYDYKITIPSLSRVYKVTGIAMENRSEPIGCNERTTCSNRITQYKLDSTLYNPSGLEQQVVLLIK